MASVISIHGQEFTVREDRDEVMRRIVAASGETLSHGGISLAPLGWLGLTDKTSDLEMLIQASSIGYVRHA